MKKEETKKKHSRNAVIMGRKTFESLHHKKFPLSGRLNVIITKEKKDEITKMVEKNKWRGVLVVGNLSAALAYLNQPKWKEYINEVFVMGGKTLFDEGIQYREC